MYKVTLEAFEDGLVTGAAMNNGQEDIEAAVRFALLGFTPYMTVTVEQVMAKLIVEHAEMDECSSDFRQIAIAAHKYLEAMTVAD